jgi:alkylation response protein AidB-like acyl-CoA dehydrogenase
VFEGRDAAAGERWQRLAEMGLFGVMAPEAHGGMGLTDADFVLLAEEAGRAALPEPLAEQAGVAVPVLGELTGVARAAALLGPAAGGRARIALVHPLHRYANVPPGVTHWLVCRESAIGLFDASEVHATAQPSIDAGRRLAHIDVAPDVVAPVVVAPDGAGWLATGEAARAITGRAGNRGALYAAAQCLGVATRMLELAVGYAKEREQFGKPIGSYQALKHQLANVQVKLEFARPVVYAAVAVVAQLDARAHLALSHAKLAAWDAADLAARTAIQVFGAMGYSWEVDLHFYMKRAWALAGAWGDRNFHARRVQSLLCEDAFALGPDGIFEYGASDFECGASAAQPGH